MYDNSILYTGRMSTDLDIILKKYKQGKREDLIPLLQEIQDDLGYLSEEAIVKTGSFLGLSTTKIYGLATFYDSSGLYPQEKFRSGFVMELHVSLTDRSQ